MVVTARPAPAAPRRRPRDRKQQIIAAAGDLFYRHGYANVSTGQIAESVGITAGALYRHFSSKQDLLAHALTDAFERGTDAVGDGEPPPLEDMVAELATTAGVRRDLGVLWSRETRHLESGRRAEVRARFFAFVARFAAQLHARRPEISLDDADLLSWCVLAVLTSPSYHRTPMSESGVKDLLQRSALAVASAPIQSTPIDSATAGARVRTGLQPHSRKEAILAVATRLFNENGYQSVTMDDIGAEVGITSTAVYKYYPSKADLLSATIARASVPLQLGLNNALAAASTPEEALHKALAAYVDFAMVHHDLLGILVSEVGNLPSDHRHDVRRSQHDYVAEWVRLLTETRPELSTPQARYLIQAMLTVVIDTCRTQHLRERPSLPEDLRLVTTRILAVEL
ncbi:MULTISPECIES: TetR/AcrR family transcriptional regulator [unclassified Nocardioides]|uniref:TetR/AcrR family transcriptional regulator n=1 Tax=unclassified Nocardioides TaxID=2615069 RepID=UPI0006F63A86|nr:MULTISPECIES: TetR/AcrR family transcriptional regulator [unclassified Nocardioides]KQY57215.1 TetR family transcriptional regulator [Nocardioides sp. Root140]KQZ68730.1 TetR family transcriptional regulator [Nocardioides sp. Root151]KRF11859.1 TetR family transcriptional regulator [Nocardioides sp. Soil796]